MQTKRKCAQCNTLNDEKQMFCINCGRYLQGKSSEKEKKATIWGIDAAPGIDRGYGNHSQTMKENTVTLKYAVCPECGSKNAAANGMLPLSCSACGYFFQAGIDRLISGADLSDRKDKKEQKPEANTVVPDHQRSRMSGPLRRVESDKTSMRLTAVSSSRYMPETLKNAGNLLGKNGTMFRGFTSEQQMSIWHTTTGWYARTIIGSPLYNGVPMNQGIQVKLATGDLIVMDQEHFMVEIVDS